MKKSVTTILSLIFLLGLIYIGWVVVTTVLKIFLDSLKNLNQNQTTLLIAIVPSTISILGIVFSNNLQKSKDIDFKNRQKKERAYDTFIKTFYEFINQSRSGKTNDELMPLAMKSRKELVLWGSDEVVKRFSEFMSISQEVLDDNPNKNDQLNAKLEQIILAIRKDLGYKNNMLNFGDLARFFK